MICDSNGHFLLTYAIQSFCSRYCQLSLSTAQLHGARQHCCRPPGVDEGDEAPPGSDPPAADPAVAQSASVSVSGTAPSAPCIDAVLCAAGQVPTCQQHIVVQAA